MATKTATAKKTAPAAKTETPAKPKRAEVRKIDDAKLKKLGEELWNTGGGSKTAVFRALFAEGYTIGEVFTNCKRVLWPKLIRPHVQNEHKRWADSQK